MTVRIDSATAQYQISPDNRYGYPSALVAAYSEAGAYWTGHSIPDAHDQRIEYVCISQPSCTGSVIVLSYSLTLAAPGTVVVSGGTYAWSYAQGAGSASARCNATVLSIVVQ